MPNTFFGLTIGSTGLYGANIGINTTAHNVSNTETDGYCRQEVHMKAGNALRMYGTAGMMGTGVEVIGIEQQRSEYYDRKYRSNNTVAGFYNTQEYYLKNIENYLNEIQLKGFNTTFNQFNDSLQELSKNAADLTVRTEVTNFAQSFCEYFNFLSNSLLSIQEDTNFEVKNQVDTINSLGKQIAGLTKQINTLEITGGMANDLRDARALLVDQLSNIVDISVEERVVGVESVGLKSYSVKIGESHLVDTYQAYEMKVVPRERKINTSDLDGLYEVTWSNGQSFNPLTTGGTLQSLFEVRDGNNDEGFNGRTTATEGDTTITVTGTNINKVELLNIATTGIITIGNKDYTYNGFQVRQDDEGNFEYEFSLDEELKKDVDDIEVMIGKSIDYKGIPYYLAQMNEFVRTYAKAFNDIHKNGQNLKGEQGLDFFNATHTVTAENYVFEQSPEDEANDILFTSKTGIYAPEEEEFNYGSYYFMTASNFIVTKAVYTDPNMVAAGTNILNGIDNNDNVNDLIKLADDVHMFKQGKPGGFLQTLIAELGIDTDKSTSFNQNQQDIVATIDNQRLSVSGVDTEEESMNLIRYQHAYNLSSKIISTMNEIYNKLINEMGV